jgi:hypothetical protein
MRIGGVWALGLIVATTGCNSILGDFGLQNADATTGDLTDGATADAGRDGATADGGRDGTTTPGADSGFDATVGDARSDGGGPPGDATTDSGPAGCATGLNQCAAGCIALDAATACGSCTNDCTARVASANVVVSSIGCNGGRCTYTCASGYDDCSDSGSGCPTNLGDAAAHCAQCGHGCNRGACTAATCGAYVIAQQPTTGAVAKLATDGTRVLWSDTGIVAIKQIAAAGGNAIVLASSAQGAVGSELALAGRTVAFAVTTATSPSIGLATVDVADSGTPVIAGALAVGAVSLNAAATHVFYVDTTGTQSSLNDCLIGGLDAGACVGVLGGGRFLGQTAADSTYLFFEFMGANPYLYIDTISTNTANMFAIEMAQSLAVDGTWAYWTVLNDGGASYTIQRTLESNPGLGIQTVVGTLASSAFATDAVNVYYWTGSAIASKPVAGGAETILAPASSFLEIAVGGGLLVWTDGATIWGLVLPAH